MSGLWIFGCFILGSCLGSFLCLCAQRLHADESLLAPRSHCDHCGRALGAGELIPLLSYLLLKGKCRSCGGRIPASFFWREMETGLLFAVLGQFQGPSVLLLIQWGILSLLLLLSWLDEKEMMLYEDLFLPLGILILLQHLWQGENIGWALGGAALPGGVLYFYNRLLPGSVGEGDIKLTALLGLWLGPVGGMKSLFAASAAAFLFLLGKRAQRKEAFREPIPFAPFLCGAAFFMVLWESGLQQWAAAQQGPSLFCLLGVGQPLSAPYFQKIGEQFQKRLKRFFCPLPRQLLAFYLDEDEVAVCQLKKGKEKWLLERFLAEPLPAEIRSAVREKRSGPFAEWLAGCCRKKGLTARYCAVTLPFSASAWALLALPALSAKERKEAASWEILQKIPYAAGTFALSLGQGPQGKTAAFAVEKTFVEFMEEIGRALHWQLLSAEPAAAVLGRYLEQEPFAWIICPEREIIRILLLHHGQPWYVSGIPRQSRNALEGVERGLLWGETETSRAQQQDAVKEKIRQENQRLQFTLPPPVYVVPEKADEENPNALPLFSCFETASCYVGLEKRISPRLLALTLGAAFSGGDGPDWNCLEPDFLPSWAGARRGMQLGGAVTLAVLLFCSAFCFLARQQRQNARDALSGLGEWETVYAEDGRRNVRLARWEAARRKAGQQNFAWPRWLVYLGRELPADCYLTGLHWEKGEGGGHILRLEGRTLEKQQALRWLETLKQDPDIAAVALKKMEAAGEQEETEFAFWVQLKKGRSPDAEKLDSPAAG